MSHLAILISDGLNGIPVLGLQLHPILVADGLVLGEGDGAILGHVRLVKQVTKGWGGKL